MTIQEANRYITNRLTTIYDQAEASNISDWVIENLAGVKRTDRIISKNQSLNLKQAEQLELYITRLLTHEPVQYVLNEAWFCGLKFYVDKNVLIPRPETEELVEWIISGCKFPIDKLFILDIGTGSGCIPIALKRRLGKATVWSCDISTGALQVAKRNALTLGVDVNFTELDFLNKEQWDKLPAVDIVVSNPPYIDPSDEHLKEGDVRFEPLSALIADNHGLADLEFIIAYAPQYLTENGWLLVEHGYDQGSAVRDLFTANHFDQVNTFRDFGGNERVTLGRKLS